ncbi:MAG: prephenate dehydrogenase/arogenate dehydrogenase family protein [Gammaproteobacteria bacterium]|nr:prephenate dehydrogenase/arogenate dehydrogenase family protein [Gammaproteobacteria bacterium]
MIRQLTIIGVGLIGGSLARALKAAGYCQEVVGCARDQSQLQRALELGVIDRASTDIATAVQGADVVVLAVPLGAMEMCFRAMAGHVADDAIITDVGSAKASVVAAARAAFRRLPAGFVPGHPIAGTEKSGVEASFTELFHKRRVILTPVPESAPGAVAKVRQMWEQTGAVVEEMNVEHHDEVLAATSHLPHLLAFGLVDSLVGMDESEEIFRFAAGGFRDFTRIASSDPLMWRDICLANREAILKVLAHYSEDLAELTRSVRDGNGAALESVFRRAKDARDRYAKQLEN